MKSKREIAREIAKVAQVTILRRGSFTCACASVEDDDRNEMSGYGFSKCALSFDRFNPNLGAKIAVNRALNELAQAVLDKDENVLGFAPWEGETDYGVVYLPEIEEEADARD